MNVSKLRREFYELEIIVYCEKVTSFYDAYHK